LQKKKNLLKLGLLEFVGGGEKKPPNGGETSKWGGGEPKNIVFLEFTFFKGGEN